MTDFKVKTGIDGFRYRGRSYKPGELISISDGPGLDVLKSNPLVEEIQVQAPAQPIQTTAPAPETPTVQAKKISRKK